VGNYENARRIMVEHQLSARGISDSRVLAAMSKLPRERFMPADVRSRAYSDSAVSIGEGQTISQPYMVALMTEQLQVEDTHTVLEVGTGSGFQCAVLAELASHVYTIERIKVLSERAKAVLCEQLGYENISFRVGDGTLGWPEEAPFDRIMVTAAAPDRPNVLFGQLVPGGKMVVPVGSEHVQTLVRYEKGVDGDITADDVCQCVFVKLIGADGW